ncbi:meiotic cell cortex C-terminal pleckstrin homology-domain-containing protein [Dichotomocladium elegans]|nr:meiotic cell cortex C-terminal pleckstrin homology-domain-containing protein [Dichotomocladium elegans]
MEAILEAAQEEKLGLALRSRHLKEDLDRYKEENWRLQITLQDIQNQLDLKDAQIARITAEYRKERRQVEDIENIKAQEDKDVRILDCTRSRLLRELRILKKENCSLQKRLENEINSQCQQTQSIAIRKPDARTCVAAVSTPTHTSSKELEVLRQSLTHADCIITDLWSLYHKEKLERIETSNLLAECQNTIEALSAPEFHQDLATLKAHIYKHSSRDNHDDYQQNVEPPKPSRLTLFSEIMQQQHHNKDITKEEGAVAAPYYHKGTQTMPMSNGEVKATQTHDKRLPDSTTYPCRPYMDSEAQCNMVLSPDAQKKRSYLGLIRRTSLIIRQGVTNKLPFNVNASSVCHHAPPLTLSFSSVERTAASLSQNTSEDTVPAICRTGTTMDMASNQPDAPSVADTALQSKCEYNDSRVSTTPTAASMPFNDICNENKAAVLDDIFANPDLVQSVTQAMVGDWLWKYTRSNTLSMTSKKKNAGDISCRRSNTSHSKCNKRYFWIHPYTCTLFWSKSQPDSTDDKSKLKRALLRDVWNIPGSNHCLVVPFSLLIRTSERDIVVHAEDPNQHHQWLVALRFSLGKKTAPVSTSHEVASYLPSPTQQRWGTALSHTHNINGFKNKFSCSIKNITNQHLMSVFLVLTKSHQEENEADESDDMVNVRQCCSGRHDITTLARK